MHIPVLLCIGTIIYHYVDNDHTDTLLPRKELPWRHNQTRAHLVAQHVYRRVVAVFKVAIFGIGGRNCFKLYAVL